MGTGPERERENRFQCGATGDQKKRKWKVASHTHRYAMDPRKNEAGEIAFEKVRGLENPADAMTKHVPANTLNIHMKAMAQSFADGRASVTPALVD